MQRATATAGRWVGALSAGLALPLSLFAQAGSLDGDAARARLSRAGSPSETVLDRWHDYALSSITPQFSWALHSASYGAPQVLDNYNGSVAARASFRLRDAAASQLEISIATRPVTDSPSVLPGQADHLFAFPQSGLQRTVVAPSLVTNFGDHGTVRLTGVLAYQRFASLGLGFGNSLGDSRALAPTWLGDSSYGTGARVDVGSLLGERINWNVGYQSRVGMGAFANYRGVFADSGDFDIPASATASIAYAITPRFGVDVGVQRVQYSAITPFTSPNLPVRFLALLGDGGSPVFAWRDLNVYSVGWTLKGESLGNLQLRYTTRQQPVPTSRLLERALADSTANDMVSLGWSRAYGQRTHLSFTASYATSPYFLLMPTYLQRADATASQFEFEALWSVLF